MILKVQHKEDSKLFIIFDLFLYSYVLLLPIGTGLAGIIGSISLLNYFVVGIVVCSVLSLFNRRKLSIKRSLLPTILYFFYSVVSVLWSPETTLNWYVATNFSNFVLLLVLNTHQWKEHEIENINKYIELSQLIVLVAVAMNISSLFDYRLTITIVSTIGISDFACGLCLIIALWMSIASTTNNESLRLIALIAVAIDVAIIIMAGSRGALAMLFSMVIVWVFLGNYSIKRKIIIAVIVLGAYYFFTYYFVQLLPTAITDRLTFSAIEATNGSGRFNIWRLAWGTFKSSSVMQMIFGHGFNSFLHAISYGSHGGHQDLMAHNAIVQTMIEGGIIGVLLLVNMFISQFKLAWKRKDNMMLIAVVGLVFASLSIDMQVTRIWGFILTLNCVRQIDKVDYLSVNNE